MINVNSRLSEERTEEVQSIIERMPTRFGLWVTAIVITIFILIFVFGWIVRYPDIITGQVTINANFSPIKLVSNGNGKLKLYGINSMDSVKEGQIIAFIENATNPKSVVFIDSLLKRYNPNTDEILNIEPKLPYNFSMGELNVKYYSFVNSLQELINYRKHKIFDKQSYTLHELLNEQNKAIATADDRLKTALKSLNYNKKFFLRDSILFAKRIISELEYDKTQMSYLSGKDAYQGSLNSLISYRQSAQQTEGKIQELLIQKPEKNNELKIKLISTYNDLVDNIKDWKQKYIFVSPFNGKVQFLKFYTENQFIQAGEQVFTIIPTEDKAFGQVILPSQGAGKLKIGQEVIIKLEDYPYLEYGSITGRVKSVSLTMSTTKLEKNDIDSYLVIVDFPDQLKTNYGTLLDFKAESKGTAEIITKDRRLIARLFDNLKYVLNN